MILSRNHHDRKSLLTRFFLRRQPFEDHEREKMGPIVSGAVITSNGGLTKDFGYIADLRRAQQRVTVPGDFQANKKVRWIEGLSINLELL